MAWHEDTLYATSAEENAILVIQQDTVKGLIKGSEKDRLNNPKGIAIDPQGFLWIVDSGNNRLVKFNKEGEVISRIGSYGSNEGNFSSPQGIAISPKGIVYVADTGNERIQIFNTTGIFMNKIERLRPSDEEFDEPVDVALDISENIFLVDKGKHRVVKLDPQGTPLMFIGQEGKEDGEFIEPTSILVTREEIFVLDSGNRRIQVFDHRGRFLRKFGSVGKHKGDFIEPSSLAMKDETTIFVSDKGNKRVQALGLVYTPKSPQQLKVETDVKKIILNWSKNFESFFGHYRVYRSEDKITFRPIGSTREPSFVDENVKPNITYFYRVSSVAKEGNESEKSPVAEGKAKPLILSPPTEIIAAPGENRISLSWQASKEEEVTSYIVYREVDGTFKEVGRVNTTSFTERGLKTNTTYSYKVTAISTEGEESQGAFIKATTIIKKLPLDVTVLKTHDIFSRAYKIYERDGIGRTRINNNTDKQISKVKVSFMTKEFMVKPVDVEIKEIPSGESVDIDIKPAFSNKILSLRENKSVEAEINVTYFLDGEIKSYSMTHPLMVIATGRRYTEADEKRFLKAIDSLDEKVSKKKAEKDVIKKIKEELDISDALINKLKTRNLSYGEIIICVYLSNQARKSTDDILAERAGGQTWPEIISSYDLSITDMIYTLDKIEKGIGIKGKPKPKGRPRETERGYFK
ncbi:MAG: 6-bladed beta-propeller [Nitrospirota bacterium]